MKTIKLTDTNGSAVSINTNNIQYVRPTTTFMGEPRTEIVMDGATVVVQETLAEVEGLLSESNDSSLTLLEEQAKDIYSEI